MQMDMIFTYNALQDTDIFRIAYLDQKIATALLYVALQNVVAVFRHPNQMYAYTTYCM